MKLKYLGIILCLLVLTAPSWADMITGTLHFSYPDVTIEEVERDGQVYTQVSFASNVPMAYHLDSFWGPDSIGLPEMACRNARYAIPWGHKVSRISEIQYTEEFLYQCEEGVYIIPSQHPQPTRDGYLFEPFQHVNEQVYQHLYSFPDDSMVVRVVDPSGTWENLTMGTVQVTPFKYNAITGELMLLTSVRFTLETEPMPASSISTPPGRIPWPSYLPYPVSYADQREMVENPEMVPTPMSDVRIEKTDPWIFELIVIPDSSYMAAAEQLYWWRVDNHQPPEIFTLGQIEEMWSEGDLPEKIRHTFRLYHYRNGAMAMVVVGDIDDEFTRYLYPYDTNTQPGIIRLQDGTCLYLGEFTRWFDDWDLDGDGIFGEPTHDRPDLYTEGWVGLVPARTPEEFQTYVNKLIQYEQLGSGCNLFWLTTCMDQMRDGGQAGFYSRCVPDYVTVDTTSLIEMPTGWAPNPYSPFGQTIEDWYHYNKPAYVVESSHGSPQHNTGKTSGYNGGPKSYMSTYQYGEHHGYIYDLTNSGCLMTMWTLSCDVFALDAKLWYADVRCMGESYILVPNGGCVIYNGHSRAGWVHSSLYMTQKYWDHIFHERWGHIAGVAHRNTRLDYVNYRQENYTMVLGGDPAVSIYTDEPREFVVHGPSTVGIGWVTFDHIVTDQSGSPVPHALVTIRQNEEYTLGYVAGDGSIRDQNGQLIRWHINHLNDIYLTVSAWSRRDHNFLTHQMEIEVSNTRRDFTDNKAVADQNLPTEFSLSRNYPNPFNATTVFEYTLPVDCQVTLEMLNLLGQKVATLIQEPQSAGYYKVVFDGTNNSGQELTSGIYFYRLSAGDFSSVQKMSLLR